VIDIRNAWKDGEESKLVSGCENVVYDYRGRCSALLLVKTRSSGRWLMGDLKRTGRV